MKKIIIAGLMLAASLTKAQAVAEPLKDLSAEQKTILTTTWYESPKESSGNTLVYRLTEYVMVVGQDFFSYPPGKIVFTSTGNFSGENIKVGRTATPAESNVGKWSIKGGVILLDFGKQTNKVSILSIEKNKLVLKSE